MTTFLVTIVLLIGKTEPTATFQKMTLDECSQRIEDMRLLTQAMSEDQKKYRGLVMFCFTPVPAPDEKLSGL